MSYKVAVKVINEPNWSYNAQRFATKEEANQAGNSLLDRWSAAEKFESQLATEPVNYKWENGQAIAVDTTVEPSAPPVAEGTVVEAKVMDNPAPDLVTPAAAPVTKRPKKEIKPKKKYPTFADGSSMQGLPGHDN